MSAETTDERLETLITAARDGGKDQAVHLSKYLRRVSAPVALLQRLCTAPEDTLRMAGAFALGGREEPPLLALVSALVQDDVLRVRSGIANAWKRDPSWPVHEADGRRLLDDENAGVRCAAVTAAVHDRVYLSRVLDMVERDGEWEVRQSAAKGLRRTTDVEALGTLLRVVSHDDDIDVARDSAEALEHWLVENGVFPTTLASLDVAGLERCRERVEALSERRFPLLFAWVDKQAAYQVDPTSLGRIGTHLTSQAEAEQLPRYFGMPESADTVIDLLTGEAPRAVVLLGDPGTGKTLFVYEMTRRLAADPEGAWHVVRVAPNDILAGTKWLGEWETKVTELVKAVKAPKRVVLYIPNAHDLSKVGRSSSSDTNVASMLMQHIESGDIAILAESTPRAWQAGTGADPALRRLFTNIEFQPAPEQETRDIARRVVQAAGCAIEDETLSRLLELASFYMAGTAQPGRSVGLLRRVLDGRPRGSVIEEADLLAHIAQSTGVPLSILDDRVPLNLGSARQFFKDRVMGQPKAIDAVVDLVTLIKAGLTDPSKPYGIQLFVGPTGVGKTELARALAEMLFGDAARLKRFDMSEYASHSAFERLIGSTSEPGLLTAAVRDDPFAVILLDEIEKAHVNVFDLCLQIFDAGRLTDASGSTSDFRQTIFILTSNVGSRVEVEAAVGFGDHVPPPPGGEGTARALRQIFRPEFLGRIDAIVQFDPLSLETARRIARREVAAVLERSGIARRRLSVDVDPSVFSFLLQRGYSPELGARPLKRTVERAVLLPVARAIARGHVPPASILRLVVVQDEVRIQIEKPEGTAEPAAPLTPAQVTPGLTQLRAQIEAMQTALPQITEPAEALRARRRVLLDGARVPDFWDDRPRAARDMDEVHRSEGLLAAVDTLERRVRDTHRHVFAARAVNPDLIARLEELGREERRLLHLLACTDPRQLGDAWITITRVRLGGREIHAVESLACMYVGFAQRNRLEVLVVSDLEGGTPPEDSITLLVSGIGAMSLLTTEAGLHQFLRPVEDQNPARRNANQEVVRVAVLPMPEDEEPIQLSEVRIESRPLERKQGRLIPKPAIEVSLLHRPSMASVHVWTAGPKQEAVTRLLPLLAARVQAPGQVGAEAAGPVIRRYRLGSSPSVRDLRTGRQSTQLDRILKGELGLIH